MSLYIVYPLVTDLFLITSIKIVHEFCLSLYTAKLRDKH